jgi:hypothetical protein
MPSTKTSGGRGPFLEILSNHKDLNTRKTSESKAFLLAAVVDPPIREFGVYSRHKLLPASFGEHFEPNVPTVHTGKKHLPPWTSSVQVHRKPFIILSKAFSSHGGSSRLIAEYTGMAAKVVLINVKRPL